MVFSGMTKEPDIVDRLLDAADRVDDLGHTETQVLLRHAAVTIRNLRDLVGIRDEVELEDTPPEGHA